jgi:hypothetical protein
MARGRFQVEDIYAALLARDMQLWLVWREGIRAVAVTQITNYPRLRALNVAYLAGEDRGEWLQDLEDRLLAWGRQVGCSRLEVQARLGWRRALANILPQWKTTHVGMERDVPGPRLSTTATSALDPRPPDK